MGWLYCSIGGTIYRGEDPPRAGGQGERRPGGGGSTRGCASPNPNPNGLWQPIRVRPAARGRQQPAARVAPPQTLMGCGPVVAAAQTLPIQYSNTSPQSDRQTLRTFRLVLNSVNNVEGSPLVKMSAYCDDIGTCRTRRSPTATRSRMKWRSISICFVR
jgi:hypothetical protein